MKLEDVVKGKGSVQVTARIPTKYSDFLSKNNISLKALIIAAIDELEAKKK